MCCGCAHAVCDGEEFHAFVAECCWYLALLRPLPQRRVTDTHTKHRKSIGDLTRRTLLRNLAPMCWLRWTHPVAYHPAMMLHLDEHCVCPCAFGDVVYAIVEPASYVLEASAGWWLALCFVGECLCPVP